jgi:fluoroacetyl-CoA thioesterase
MIEIGTTNEASWTVAREQLASAFGSGLVDALATPVLVGFCEECARTMIDPHLPPDQKTVGTSVRLDHVAATPLGMRVTVRATLVEIDRRRLRFEVEAHDEIELVGRATHERFIIDSERFAHRLRQKTQNASSQTPTNDA